MSIKRVFTFGFGQELPDGRPAKNFYVVIKSFSEAACRDIMFDRYGRKWSMMYDTEDLAGVKEYGLQLLEEIDDIGDVAICDLCGKDWTGIEEGKGQSFLFGSKGVCPDCAPEFYKKILSYREEDYIKGWALPDETFHRFTQRLRKGNNLGIYQPF